MRDIVVQKGHMFLERLRREAQQTCSSRGAHVDVWREGVRSMGWCAPALDVSRWREDAGKPTAHLELQVGVVGDQQRLVGVGKRWVPVEQTGRVRAPALEPGLGDTAPRAASLAVERLIAVWPGGARGRVNVEVCRPIGVLHHWYAEPFIHIRTPTPHLPHEIERTCVE